ncbi:hypothetical protein EDC01DRAFT_615871 [Geopyxis carbonaria]|nr:hypothetical protein EDC01DRAFT_615871 [Geopyxis carbonaria]
MDGTNGYHGLPNGGIVAGKNGALPFFVRVNGIVWPQTETYRLDKSQLEELSDDESANGEEWAVEVTGLTGSTEYDFEFVRNGGGIFYTTSACTLPATQAMSSTTVPPSTPQPSRPLSPITTLLHSLTQAKARLDETKTNLKSVRKTHKNGLSEIRKDIERNRSLIGNDRGEERAFRRNLALKESIKRAEEENEAMAKELANLESLPEKMKPEWQEKKKQWQAEKQRLRVAQAKASEDKSNADRHASAVESEVTSLTAKKEKLSTRLAKLRTDLDRLVLETAKGSGISEKKQFEREIQDESRKALEGEFIEVISRLELRINDCTARAHENWSTLYAMENATLQHMAHMGSGSGDMIPGSRNSGVFGGSPGLMLQDQMSHGGMDMSMSGGRERSSSIFSDNSVITNFSELGGTPMYMPAFEPLGTRHSSIEYTPVPIGIERKYSG